MKTHLNGFDDHALERFDAITDTVDTMMIEQILDDRAALYLPQAAAQTPQRRPTSGARTGRRAPPRR